MKILLSAILLVTSITVSHAADHSHARGEKVAEGRFTSGISYGHVAIFSDGEQWIVSLADDFKHDGSPDPWVALGADGFRRDGIIGELAKDDGGQLYPIGKKLIATEFNEIYIWCVEHNTSLGRARLIWLK